jgi:hypothetical protein
VKKLNLNRTVANTYYSIATYLSPGGAISLYTIPFPYIDKSDVFVWVNGTYTTSWTYLTDTQVKLTLATAGGDKVVIRRITRRDARLAEYYNGSVLTENDLNVVTKQLLYIIQELFDLQLAGSTGDFPPGGVANHDGSGTGAPPSTGDIIDEITANLLNSQLFKDLTALIPLVDINSETLISNALKDHQDWSQSRYLDKTIRDTTATLGAVDAKYLDKTNILQTNLEQTVTNLQALLTSYNGSQADYVSFKAATSTATSANATAITALSATVGSNTSRIGTLETVKIDSSAATALIQTQLNSRFTQSNTDTFINASSYINAIRSKNTAQDSQMSAIQSYIAGAGVTVDSDGNITWPATPTGLAGALATAQTQIAVVATKTDASTSFTQAFASKYTSGDSSNPTAIVAALENSYKTYVDSGSALVTRVSTLEVNRQPIFFRSSAPNPYASEFGGMYNATQGFPEGSLWYRQSGTKLYPFWWKKTTSDANTFFGPFTHPTLGTVPGIWVQNHDDTTGDVLGARIDSLQAVTMTSSMVDASIQNTLTTVFNQGSWSGVNTIAQRLESLIDPSNGLMYSSWNVRINQYLGTGTPVIAGVGLGMQSDPNNPNKSAHSQFIIMADQLGVIKPPAIDPLGGALDLSTVVVPFVIDTATGTVGINGRLMVKGSLGAYDGAMGRLMATQLNSDATVTDPNGMRAMLVSRFNDYNASNAPSPFTGTNPQRFLFWAGSGTMNHNNAVFYVDEEGNAFFGGTIMADNINGQFGDYVYVNGSDPPPVAANAWTYMYGTVNMGNVSGRGRDCVAIINVNMPLVPSGGANVVVQMDYESSPGTWANAWSTVADGSVWSRGNIALIGSFGSRSTSRFRMRVGLQTSDNLYNWSDATFSGVLMGVR